MRIMTRINEATSLCSVASLAVGDVKLPLRDGHVMYIHIIEHVI